MTVDITYDLVEYEVVFKLFRIEAGCGAEQRDLVCLYRDLESIIGNEHKKRLERAWNKMDTDKKGQSKCRIGPKGQGRLVNVLPLCLLAKFLVACPCLKDNLVATLAQISEHLSAVSQEVCFYGCVCNES